MQQGWKNSVLAILDAQGNPVGTGFLAANNIVATCAHTVRACRVEAGNIVQVRFSQSEEILQAVILEEYRDEFQDVAFLKLHVELKDLPKRIPLSVSENSQNHPVQLFGYPDGSAQGKDGRGTVAGFHTDPDNRHLIRIDMEAVTPDFSGAPVWDEALDSAIGMVTLPVMADDLKRADQVVLVVPTENLGRACATLNEFIKTPIRGDVADGQSTYTLRVGKVEPGGIAIASLTIEPGGTLNLPDPAPKPIDDSSEFNKAEPALDSRQEVDALQLWLQNNHFFENPFQHFTAETESDVQTVFIDPSSIRVRDLWTYPGAMIIYAEHGTGKTALQRFIVEHSYPTIKKSNILTIVVDKNSLTEMIRQTGQNTLDLQPIHFAFKILQSSRPLLQRRSQQLNQPDKNLIRDVEHYLDQRIEKINADPHELIDALVKTSLDLKFHRVLCIVDQVDEPAVLGGKAENMARLLPALLSIDIRETKKFLIRFLLPEAMRGYVNAESELFRPDRCHIVELTWTELDLQRLIRQRLMQFSEGPVPCESLQLLCNQGDREAQQIEKELIRAANGRPRAALWLANRLIQTHCAVENPSLHIQARDWQIVKESWINRDYEQFFFRPYAQPVTQEPVSSHNPDIPLHLDGDQIYAYGREVVLQQRYHLILKKLILAEGKVCSHLELAQAIVPGERPGDKDRGPEDTIRRIRNLLTDYDLDRNCIQSVRGRGYRIDPTYLRIRKTGNG